jgi:hypothetical protein
MPSTKTVLILGIGAAFIVGIWYLYSKQQTAKERTALMVGAALGRENQAIGKSAAPAATKAMRTADSPIPPHSPATRAPAASLAGSSGRNSFNQTTSQLRSQSQPPVLQNRQPLPRTTRMPIKAANTAPTVSRPVTRPPSQPKGIRSTTVSRRGRFR